jgi:DNA-binding PadR family transcriptional regulator
MRSPVTTHAALLQALRWGASYGLELIRRVETMSAGRIRLTEARVYPALKDLKRRGFVTASRFSPRGRRGARSRTYYDLTLKGVQVSTLEHAALRALVASPENKLSPREGRLMARRLQQAEELSEFSRELRAAMPTGV